MGKVKLFFDQKDKRCVSVTEQSHANECDINMIIARAEKSGMFPVSTEQGMFGDFSAIDFEAASIQVARAKELFMSLPVNVRSRFSNDVGELLSFVDNPANVEEARKLGLLPAAKAVPAGAGTGTPEASKDKPAV